MIDMIFTAETNTILLWLVILSAADYATGVGSSIIQGKGLSSEVGYKGLIKKSSQLGVMIVTCALDTLVFDNSMIFRGSVGMFFILNEALSLVENVANCGVPIPNSLLRILIQVKQDYEKKDEGSDNSNDDK